MLKKLKCIEATATLASSNMLNVASNNVAATSSLSIGNCSHLGTNVKIIKTEPIDFEMLHLEEKDLRERRLTRDAETTTTSQPRYQHVQIQTVAPRQPSGLTTGSSATQKVILTPRVEYIQRATSTSSGTTIKHIYQHVDEPPPSQQHVPHIVRRPSRSPNVNESGGTILSTGAPQIIITRTLPTTTIATQIQQQQHVQHLQRRHSASPSATHHYQRNAAASTTSSASSSPPPPLHQRQQQHTPPPLSLQHHHQQQQQQQHVRVIRDGRLYEETATSVHHAPLSRRHSVSPPPLHHHSRSAPVSPAVARRYSVSPHEHVAAGGGEQHVLLHYQQQRQVQHSPPPPQPPPPPSSSSSVSNMAQRKYVVTTTRHVNVISTNVSQHQQQQQPQHYSQPHYQPQHHSQHQQHLHHQQQQQQQQSPATSSPPSSSTASSAHHVFRTPVVSSSSGSAHNSSNSSTAMRPPPPPPPPKIKNTSPPMSVGMGSSCSGSGSGMGGSCEEPSSSIPDLEFDGTTVLCRVCGDKASGFHYGVHSCEGCKGFFRRSIQQKIQYRPCTKNQQCSILRINRNRCQYCRLKKCIAVGMSRDAVRFGRVPKREKARILAAMQQSTQNRGQQRALATELDDQPRLLAAVLRAHLDTCEFTKEKVAAMRQRARECPSYSMPTLLACPLNPAPELQSEQEFSQRFAHVIRGVIDFAGMIPGFQLLTQDDKFTLLKAGLFDALFVRLICMFDSSINSIICLNGQVMRRDAIQNGANARFLVDSTFNFAERMNSMNLSDAEIGLFCAIVLITPDRPGLRNLELIEKMYSRLKGCLQSIINQNRPDQPEFMAKLLETMPDLRTLSTLHTEKLVVFRTEHKELLRQQMWTMDDEQPPQSKSPGSSWDDARMDVEAKSPLGSVSSTESGDLEYTTSSTTGSSTGAATQHQQNNHHSMQQQPQQQQQPSALASSAPLLAASLSGSCPLRTRANSGSSGDSTADMDIVGSHAHLTQNGLTITPIVRTHSHQQLHHHLTNAVVGTQHRYRKLDSPTDSGIESGNEKNECGSSGSKAVSSGGSSSCSSPRSSVDDALDCSDAGAAAAAAGQVTVSVSPVRSPQPTTTAPTSSTSAHASQSTLKRQIVEDMPVLKRVLQAPPLYDTNSLMDEAYKPHKKFRALRHREFESADADPSSSTSNGTGASTTFMPAGSPVQSSSQAAHSPPPSLVVPQASVSPLAAALSPHPSPAAMISASSATQQHHHQPPQHLSQLHMHLTRPTPTNNNNHNNNNHHHHHSQQQSSLLSSTHSVLAKSLMAEPRMTPEQMKRSDIIQNYLMRDPTPASSTTGNNGLLGCHTPNGHGSRSPAPPQHVSMHAAAAAHHHAAHQQHHSSSSSNSNCASPSTTTVTLASPPPPATTNARWSSGHSVITTTSLNQRQQSVSPSSNGSSSSSSSSSSTSSTSSASSSSASSGGTSCQYFQSPHSTSASVSPPRPSPSAMHTTTMPARLLELQVDIADSQQPLNLSKKSPTPPPSKLQALVAAATAAQRYPIVSADVTVTATSSPPSVGGAATAPTSSTVQQVQVHKVKLEA